MNYKIEKSYKTNEEFHNLFQSSDIPYFLDNLTKDIGVIDSTFNRFPYFFHNSATALSKTKSYEELFKLDMKVPNDIILSEQRKNLILFADNCFTNIKTYFDKGYVIEIPLYFCSFIFKYVSYSQFAIYKPSLIYEYIDSLFIQKTSGGNVTKFETVDDFKFEFTKQYMGYLLIYIQNIYRAVNFIGENNLYSSTAKNLKQAQEEFIAEWMKQRNL